MTTLWKINNIDLYSTYGVAIKQGSYLELMSPPTPRKRLEHNYIDSNGAQVDTSSPLTYEARRFSLKIIIVASSFAQFWTRYNAFIAAIATETAFILYVKDIGVTCNLLYEGMRCISKSRSLRSGRVVAEYELSVFEPGPTNRAYDPS